MVVVGNEISSVASSSALFEMNTSSVPEQSALLSSALSGGDVGAANNSVAASLPRSSALSEMAVVHLRPSRSAAVSEMIVAGADSVEAVLAALIRDEEQGNALLSDVSFQRCGPSPPRGTV